MSGFVTRVEPEARLARAGRAEIVSLDRDSGDRHRIAWDYRHKRIWSSHPGGVATSIGIA
jgi:hypothetical protein